MKECIYPGTFDPITNGHMDIIERAVNLFGKVVVAVAVSAGKKPLYSLNKRIEMAKLACAHLKGVRVVGFENLLVDFAKEAGINVCVRGLRAVSDFEYELQIGYTNASLWDELETIYLMPNLKNAFISSTIVRNIITHQGDASKLVPEAILPLLSTQEVQA
ncbi:pantetheine-phosphate adenylyltransferase [Campylobacter sp. 19-13652]|uniref:pantetheine-phosphate adenylyltransferase n=1 Tax=Campylobacter sp. 19-13652 TaxID=2840180 RepID=UPI001C78A921|nr:pantetheine-phosphate adenylyltransferase [Campylobacter sp. 19-13652]BCX79425.1 phosphopantetheine adenylyltransferase [Campylobacter sp. 19-13652]